MCTAGLHGRRGPVIRINSDRPFSPSQQTIKRVLQPRFLSSVSIVAHCLAPSQPEGPSYKLSTKSAPP